MTTTYEITHIHHNFVDIGWYLKNCRLINNLQQGVAAEQLNITQTYLSLIESNKKIPSVKLLAMMFKLYKVDVTLTINT